MGPELSLVFPALLTGFGLAIGNMKKSASQLPRLYAKTPFWQFEKKRARGALCYAGSVASFGKTLHYHSFTLVYCRAVLVREDIGKKITA